MNRYLLVLFLCLPVSLLGQELVNEVFRRVPLSKALKTIQSGYDIKIAYEHALVKNVIVDMVLTDVTIPESLQRLLHGTLLTFHHVGNNIVIMPAPYQPNAGVEKIDLKLSGRVLDAGTLETLPQAVVRVAGAGLATTTNDDGYFTILHVPSDTFSMEISYVGYITQSVRLKEISDPLQFDVRMKSDTKILNEVVVLDEYNQAIRIQDLPGTFTFNPTSLNSLPSLGEQDISRTMQLMPGVTATDESSSGMVIRGMHPGYNLVMLDGMTIYQQDHFFGAFSIINSDIVKDVRVQKGMFDAKYGGRVSGVVDITTKNGNAVKPAFNFRGNSINVKGTAEIPIGKKWSVFVGGRRSFTDVIQSTLFKDLFDIAGESNDQIGVFSFFEDIFGMHGEPRYYFYDANTKVTCRPSNRDILSLSLYTSRDKMLIDNVKSDSSKVFAIGNNEFTQWGNYGLSLRWGRQWSDRYYSSIRISDSKFFRKNDLGLSLVLDSLGFRYAMLFENSINDVSFAIDNEWLLNDHLSFGFGASGVRQGMDVDIHYVLDSDDLPGEETPDDPNVAETDKSWLNSVYGSLTASFTTRFTATAGVRLNHYYNSEGQLYVEPRLTAQYTINEALHLKGAYGRSNQFINQMIYYATTGTLSGLSENSWILSDPGKDYPVISTDQYSAGATVKGRSLVYDAEVYYKKGAGVLIDGDLNSGNTTAYGLDIMVQKTSGIHKGWIAYSLGRGLQSNPYILDGRSVPSLQDQRHELKVVDILTLGHWNLSSTLIYGSGKPYPKFTVQYHRNDDGNIDEYNLLLDYSNESRLPPYYRMDMSVSYRGLVGTRVSYEAGLSIYNVTGHKNIKTRRIDQTRLDEAVLTNTEIQPAYRDIVLLGFTPSLFLNISF